MKSALLSIIDRRHLILLLLGFSSGLPLALIVGTLQAWLTESGLSLEVIGSFSVVTLPYALKFIWAPLLDRYLPPLLGRFGRRLGWMLISQYVLVGLVAGMGLTEPREQLGLLFLLSCLLALASATQDIVVDAYRADLLYRSEQGPGASVAIFGYRLGMLTSGALALSLAQTLPWQTVYALMALLQGVGVLAALFAPALTENAGRPNTLKEAVIAPLAEYFRRSGAVELLCFIVLYKLTDVMAGMFTTTFMLQVGFAKTDIAAVVKGLGLVATIVGSLLGGISLVWLGMRRALLVFGIFQGVSNLAFAVLAMVGKEYVALALAITIENLSGGLGTAAFTAFLTSLCHQRFTATQYALLTSLAAVSRSFLGVPCGMLAAAVSWEAYFMICTVAAAPGLLLLWWRYDKWVDN